MTEPAEFAPSGFFALRTPLLPMEAFLSWGEGLSAPRSGPEGAPVALDAALAADRASLRARLRAIVSRPEVREALFLASPSLDEGISSWLADPASDRGAKAELAVIRYVSRMSSRATPFGLFATAAVGTLGEATRLRLAPASACRKHTRLDMDYLFALCETLGRDAALRDTLPCRPNTSLYRAGARLRYVEARLDGKVRSHHLVAAIPEDYLEETLARARGGARRADLAAALAGPEVPLEDALAYIDQLLDAQLLVTDLAPAVAGPEPVPALVEQLRGTPAAAALERVQSSLAALDARGLGVAPAAYREVARGLEPLPVPVELSRLFQVDTVRPVEEATLGRAVLDEIVRGVRLLHRIAPSAPVATLARFREKFTTRYESREVPLAEALDEEIGVGFDASEAPTAEASPLLRGMIFPPAADDGAVRWGARGDVLLRLLADALARGAREVRLEERHLAAMETRAAPLPDAFAAMAEVVAADEEALARGEFRVVLQMAAGPSGARLLGRFCHADEALARHVEAHLRAEEALRPEAVFAEVVHLPEGRLGNILCRPTMRGHEVPFLGIGGAPAERQLPLEDLTVSVVGDRIVLRSRRLGREVVPRLTSAHNFTARSVGTYKFLCSLQEQGCTGGLMWSWGALAGAPFLPRVVSGRVILARAEWRLEKRELAPLGAGRFAAVQALRAARGLPRLVRVADGDNELLIDLDNVLSVETFVELVHRREAARLLEVVPGPGELCVSGPDGRYAHEVVVPFVVRRPPTAAAPASPAPAVRRSFPPGSEWLYAKLYTGATTADAVLREVVGPVASRAIESGAATSWFFLRYNDPDGHLRVRFHGDPTRLRAEVEPSLAQAASPFLAEGRLWRVVFDTYEREVERYGGDVGIDLAERLFHADSEAAFAIVAWAQGDEGLDVRWRMALRGMDALLDDLGLDLDAKCGVMKRLRKSFGEEFHVERDFEKQLADRLRKERPALEALLAATGGGPLGPGLAAIAARSARVAHIASKLREAEAAGRLSVPLADLAGSFLHMHANRVLRSAHRAQELLLYDFLLRVYESRRARAKSR